MTILITGGRGHVGRSLANTLLARGEKVRVASSEPGQAVFTDGLEVVQADLSRPETLAPALVGVSRVFLYARPATAAEQVRLMEEAGIEHVTLLSTRSLTFPDADTNPIARLHVQVERALGRSRLPWTFLRAGTFATNTLQWADMIRRESVVRAPYPQSHSAPVHEDDIADVAALTLTGSGHAGVIYVMSGPESMPQIRQAELIGDAIDRPVRFEEQQPQQYRETLSRWGQADVVDQLLRYLSTWDDHPVPVVDARQQLLGVTGRSFARWAADHADDFR
ncbi:NAD(P)H-binding protein [Dactylosporangium vinaceum]|uniref:SDR family oxidoreductase n=1 Tax=Dactylosporangium vinaceum TaxID=53362 RepID=A0ABV5M387_9ACTN|nr:NAD(P)H-binding protein [Dactylosporangium vinaceum]UAB99742.1 NAD(P)H-binding protein [Dactylosporangium vinaceum]